MKYADLTARFRYRPFFEARELDIVYDEPYRQIRFRLSRWVKQEKLIQIRRWDLPTRRHSLISTFLLP